MANIFCATYKDRAFTWPQTGGAARKRALETVVECEVWLGRSMAAGETGWEGLGSEVGRWVGVKLGVGWSGCGWKEGRMRLAIRSGEKSFVHITT